MSKYSSEFKEKLVLEYLNNNISYRNLARKYNMKSYSLIREWVHFYEAYGISGLKRKWDIKEYPVKFKLNAIEYMLKTGATSLETAIKFNLYNTNTPRQWFRQYRRKGMDGLYSTVKEQSIMSKNIKPNNTQKPATKSSREKTLERKVELLELEVAYLKKLKAFRENPNAFHERRKQK